MPRKQRVTVAAAQGDIAQYERNGEWTVEEDHKAIALLSVGFTKEEIASTLGRSPQAIHERGTSQRWMVKSGSWLAEHTEVIRGQALQALATELKRKILGGSEWDLGDIIQLTLEHTKPERTERVIGTQLTAFTDMGAEPAELEGANDPARLSPTTDDGDSVNNDTHTTPGSPPCDSTHSHIDIRESVLGGEGDKQDEDSDTTT